MPRARRSSPSRACCPLSCDFAPVGQTSPYTRRNILCPSWQICMPFITRYRWEEGGEPLAAYTKRRDSHRAYTKSICWRSYSGIYTHAYQLPFDCLCGQGKKCRPPHQPHQTSAELLPCNSLTAPPSTQSVPTTPPVLAGPPARPSMPCPSVCRPSPARSRTCQQAVASPWRISSTSTMDSSRELLQAPLPRLAYST